MSKELLQLEGQTFRNPLVLPPQASTLRLMAACHGRERQPRAWGGRGGRAVLLSVPGGRGTATSLVETTLPASPPPMSISVPSFNEGTIPLKKLFPAVNLIGFLTGWVIHLCESAFPVPQVTD